MVIKDNILLVLGLHEGRRFPRRNNCFIVVEAKFDGEILTTDPIDHVESPDFSTELAWELNKKTLHQHRLQRTPVKLECFALDKINGNKELVGYCVLDQRSAQKGEQRIQWHPLLSSKYQKLKPEIKLVLSLEDDTNRRLPDEEPPKVLPEAPKNHLIPILSEKHGYYNIQGTDNLGEKVVFVISVTLVTAKNLVKLVPSKEYLKEQEGFYFHYSLVGNDVVSEPFYDLVSASFPPERASVRIFASENTLVEYIRSQPILQIRLLSGEEVLGTTQLSLLPLITDQQFAGTKQSNIKGAFKLLPPSGKSSPPDIETEDNASLDVTITLRLEEEQKAPNVITDGTSPLIASGGMNAVRVPENMETTPLETVAKRENRKAEQQEAKKESAKEQKEGNVKERAKGQKDQKAPEAPKLGHAMRNISSKTAHHYCYSIDLRTIKDMQIDTAFNCYCRYTYPFFGSSSPVVTHPPVEVRRHTEVLLPHSFCAFDFATVPEVLTETLRRVPLMVEVWHRDTYRKDYLLGIAEVQLSSVMDSPQLQHEDHPNRRIYSELRPIMTNDRRKIGALHVVLGLEDIGEVSAKLAADGPDSTQSLCSISTDVDPQQRPAPTTSQPSNEPRGMPEYAAALELEMWKEQQEAAFLEALKHKESELMKALAEEWKKRDKEREMIVKRKVDEYNKLEETLKKSISDMERREKQVSQKEAEVLRMKADLVQEHERALVDVREWSKREKENCDHQVNLERLKVKDLQSENNKLKEQVRTCEKRLKDKENEFLAYKEQQFNHPEIKLQAELNLIVLEKNELERKLEGVTKSKIHYKQQWGRALRELAKFKQSEQSAAKTRLKQQEKELEQMRLRYLASEEKAAVNLEREELKEVKEELERLKKQGLQSTVKVMPPAAEVTPAPQSHPKITWATVEDDSHQVHNNRIAKLIEERDTLLQTGVYSTDDKIITELDRQIRELISKSTK